MFRVFDLRQLERDQTKDFVRGSEEPLNYERFVAKTPTKFDSR